VTELRRRSDTDAAAVVWVEIRLFCGSCLSLPEARIGAYPPMIRVHSSAAALLGMRRSECASPADARFVESSRYYTDVGRKKRRLARNSLRENPSSRETSMKVTVVYGSSNGSTEQIAVIIAWKIGGKSINVASAKTNDFENSDLLILCTPTYESGGLQQDWEDRLDVLKEANLSGKKVALFGLGDQSSYPDSFVDAMGILYDAVTEKGATVIGETATSGYEFTNSRAVRDGKFVGLAVDEDGQPSETAQRIATWIAQLS